MSIQNPLLPRLQRLIKNCYLDVRYGGRLLLKAPQNWNGLRGWHASQSSDYQAISYLFSLIDIKSDDVIVDVGCGYGRVFNWILHKKWINKIIGIEVDEKVASSTRQKYKKHSQIQVICSDVELGIPFGTIYYLFNPFSDAIVKNFVSQLEKNIFNGLYTQQNRPVIIYYNCEHLAHFKDSLLWNVEEIRHVSFTQLNAAILSYKK